jgi:hypothetical protein
VARLNGETVKAMQEAARELESEFHKRARGCRYQPRALTTNQP